MYELRPHKNVDFFWQNLMGVKFIHTRVVENDIFFLKNAKAKTA